MRSCIYCGKELEKGELCNCSTAVNKRNAKAQDTASSDSNNNYNSYNNSNSYHTGYTKRENPFKSAWNRYTDRKNAARSHFNSAKKTPRRNIFFDTLSFFKSPINTVSNTSHLTISFVFVVSALAGALVGLCAYLILLSLIHLGVTITSTSAIALGIFSNTDVIAGIGASLIIGAVVGCIVYLLYCTSFYLVNRLIFRDSAKFRELLTSLSLCPLPLVISGILGLIFGLFSLATLVIIIFVGAIFTTILTYEVLKLRWCYYAPNQVLYGTISGFFIFALIVSSLLLII